MTGISISTHVLDTALGKPAQGLKVRLAIQDDGAWQTLNETATNQDGRVLDLLNGSPLLPGTYRLSFESGAYHLTTLGSAFYPSIDVTFQVDTTGHHHIPLLLSPYGYSTYRGT